MHCELLLPKAKSRWSSRSSLTIWLQRPRAIFLVKERAARERIYKLRRELAEIEKRRELTRKNRQENDKFTVALVGYTNAGKSTLFNKLTNSDIYADDLLFATLDTTVRKLDLSNGLEILMCDTVGFINDLPHSLLNAFKSTLEEAAKADLLLNVCDISDPNLENHIEVTEQTLAELNINAPVIRVYNKCDKLNGNEHLSSSITDYSSSIFISALTGKNIDVLIDRITDYVMLQYSSINLKFPLDVAHEVLPLLNKYAADFKVCYFDSYATVNAVVSKKFVNIFVNYIVL